MATDIVRAARVIVDDAGTSVPASPWRRLLGGGGRRTDDDFVAFAEVAGPRLVRTAYLMCRDWHLAQDLTQTTLAKMFVSWRKLSGSVNVEAYSRTVLIRSLVDTKRRRSGQEVPIPEIPPEPGPLDQPELRLTLIDALGYLSPRDRAIVVLRYWEDQSVETVAQALDLSAAVVKKQSARSLTRLRELLGREVLLED